MRPSERINVAELAYNLSVSRDVERMLAQAGMQIVEATSAVVLTKYQRDDLRRAEKLIRGVRKSSESSYGRIYGLLTEINNHADLTLPLVREVGRRDGTEQSDWHVMVDGESLHAYDDIDDVLDFLVDSGVELVDAGGLVEEARTAYREIREQQSIPKVTFYSERDATVEIDGALHCLDSDNKLVTIDELAQDFLYARTDVNQFSSKFEAQAAWDGVAGVVAEARSRFDAQRDGADD